MAELTNAQVALQAAAAVSAAQAGRPGSQYSAPPGTESPSTTLQRATEYLKWLDENQPLGMSKR